MNSIRCSQCIHCLVANAGEGKIYSCDRPKCVFESTTKNDLGVDCISRQAVIDLMMQKWGENFSGDDAMQESIDAIRALPSVTPQEPILDKIRAEIEPKCDRINSLASVLSYTAHREIQELLCEIMDLCKAESEDKEDV